VKKIRSDNGSEFKNLQVEEYLEEEGIKHEFSAPYTPQQNGVVERKNKTLIDMARTMLGEFKTPERFWSEAVNTACHAINNSTFIAFSRRPRMNFLPVTNPTYHTFVYLCDTRFAKKRSWGLLCLFFPHPVVVLGIWNLWKTFTTRALEFIWFGACDGVGSCRVG
jgi:transposase InsO family protein